MARLSHAAKRLHGRLLVVEAGGDHMGIVPAPSERAALRELEAEGLASRRPRRLSGEHVYRYALTQAGRGGAR